MILLVRHAETNFNIGDEPERFRGWSSIGLNEQGITAAQKCAQKIKEIEKTPIAFYTSDIPRAEQTAAIIATTLNVKYVPMKNLRDWHLGMYTGMEVASGLPSVRQYAVILHDKKIFGGEAYDTFLERLLSFMYYITAQDRSHPEEMTLLVTHNRAIRAIWGWVMDGEIGYKTDYKIIHAPDDPLKPCTFVFLDDIRVAARAERSKLLATEINTALWPTEISTLEAAKEYA